MEAYHSLAQFVPSYFGNSGCSQLPGKTCSCIFMKSWKIKSEAQNYPSSFVNNIWNNLLGAPEFMLFIVSQDNKYFAEPVRFFIFLHVLVLLLSISVL